MKELSKYISDLPRGQPPCCLLLVTRRSVRRLVIRTVYFGRRAGLENTSYLSFYTTILHWNTQNEPVYTTKLYTSLRLSLTIQLQVSSNICVIQYSSYSHRLCLVVITSSYPPVYKEENSSTRKK